MNKEELDKIVANVVSELAKELNDAAPAPSEQIDDSEKSECRNFPVLRPIRKGTPVLITEEILKKIANASGTVIVEGRYITTPSAEDFIRRKNIVIKQMDDAQICNTTNPAVEKIIAVGADHRGFSLKELIKSELTKLGYKVADLGTNSPETCDYPDFAIAVAKKVSSGETSLGIIIDSAGIGSSIAANKIKGIRAAVCWDETTAQQARLHNNANVLCIGADTLAPAKALNMVKIFISTDYEPNPRYDRRIKKISAIE